MRFSFRFELTIKDTLFFGKPKNIVPFQKITPILISDLMKMVFIVVL